MEQQTHQTRDKMIDGFIKVLKTVAGSNLFFGTFLIAEGLAMIFAMSLFPFFIAFSILMAYAFALEWLVNVLRGEKTIWNRIERGIIVIIIIGLLIYCGFLIFNADFRIGVDRVIVCATTIIDGTKNLIHSIRTESHHLAFRRTFVGASIICILYGLIYGIVGGAEANIFTTTLHGIVFIFCGSTNIWLYICDKRYN
ncbi:MAG: hypothetical protein Q4A25_02055 [Candidatus Saccharibacteria bacterium]|nr:hypothetical protein [Candidatus Saccharibacteria bacterium]